MALFSNYLFFCIFLILITQIKNEEWDSKYKFPDDFKFGVATSAYQVEGGWNASDKGESIWDRFTHTHPELIDDHSTGDISCDSYNRWKTDIELLKNLGVDFYRFSLSWTRLLPTGFTNYVSSDGVKFYNDFIDALIENNIEPVVTIYHWDLPQTLQDVGGIQNPEFIEYITDFARLAFSLFGDRVKTWVTINEPYNICEGTYAKNMYVPAVSSPGIGDYLCSKNILLAHARMYHLYNKEFKAQQKGTIGITIDCNWYEPLTNKPEDIEAAERAMQMECGWWTHPIFSKSGDYPAIMKERINSRSKSENFPRSRLPELTLDEIKLIQNSSDFYGINHYNTYLVNHFEYPIGSSSLESDIGCKKNSPPDEKSGYPKGMRKLLNWIKKNAEDPLILITENGFLDNGEIRDLGRVNYLKSYLNETLNAIVEDGCRVGIYTAWSLLDNMEWRHGYTYKFGLHYVDFSSPERRRIPKMSASFYKSVIKEKSVLNQFDECLA